MPAVRLQHGWSCGRDGGGNGSPSTVVVRGGGLGVRDGGMEGWKGWRDGRGMRECEGVRECEEGVRDGI